MKAELLDKLSSLIIAAFGLIAALAWNGAIRAIFEQLFGTAENIPALLVYAVIVTVIAVLVTMWITRAIKKAKGETKNNE